MMEIGSEFHWVEEEKGKGLSLVEKLNFGEDIVYTLSGRTAILLAIQEIKKQRNIKSVYMPSYCCRSMIDPFVKENIAIYYYDVHFDGNKLVYNIDINQECDIFFSMSYFGFHDSNMDNYSKMFHKKGIIVIEDITHRLLCRDNHSKFADYLVASIRKWFPIVSGGVLISTNNPINSHNLELPNPKMIEIKIEAMKLKLMDLVQREHTGVSNKNYLNKYKVFNKYVADDYVNKSIDVYSYQYIQSVNINNVVEKRLRNGEIIYSELNKLNLVKPIFNNLNPDKDCPLFIPILLEENNRDSLREYLIKNEVYCPIHWLTTKYNYKSNVYSKELSLICDQRYKAQDMMSIIELISEWESRV